MKQTKTVLIDDVDGSTADRTVSFSINGSSYEIDLSDAHADELAEDFGKWQAKARRVSGRVSTRSSRTHTVTRSSDSAKVRAWAVEQGIKVSDRGRIPAAVVEQYRAEHA